MGCSVSRSCTAVLTGNSRDSHGGPSSSSSVTVSSYSATPDRCGGARSLPSHLVHHPPVRKGDTYHLVSLTSTTYGSLFLVEQKSPLHQEALSPARPAQGPQFSLGRLWPPAKAAIEEEDSSNGGPPSPESVINTWELMDGLDSDSDPTDDGSSKKEKHTDDEVKVSSCDFVGPDDKIVLYFTSLRGIRKTFEDCCFVRTMLRGFRVAVDERDISMDSSYRKELETALGEQTLQEKSDKDRNRSGSVALPQVFIRGKHIGGAEKMKQLNEAGELGKLLDGFPVKDYRVACRNCGDARFVMCRNCSGSRKVFDKKEGRLRRCLVCNENGLTKCHLCC